MPNLVISIILVVLPLLSGLYSFWFNSKKDGFDQEKVFDLVVYGFVGGILFSVISTIAGPEFSGFKPEEFRSVNPFAYVSGFVAVVTFVTWRWRWSAYRMLDNFSVALILTMAVWIAGQGIREDIRPIHLVAAVVLFIANYYLSKYRLNVLKSGFTFCIISGVFCFAGMLSSPQTINLIFLGLLFTLTLAVLIFRSRGLYVGNQKSSRRTAANS